MALLPAAYLSPSTSSGHVRPNKLCCGHLSQTNIGSNAQALFVSLLSDPVRQKPKGMVFENFEPNMFHVTTIVWIVDSESHQGRNVLIELFAESNVPWFRRTTCLPRGRSCSKSLSRWILSNSVELPFVQTNR